MRDNSFARAAARIEHHYSTPLMLVLMLVAAGFFWLFNFSALPLSNPELVRLSGGEGLLDLMPYYTAREAFSILGKYGAAGRELYLKFLAADFVFIPVYTFGFAFLTTRAVRAVCAYGNSWLWLNLLPLGIGTLDNVENFCILGMLGFYPEPAMALGTLSGIVTLSKFVLSLLALLSLGGVGLIAITRRLGFMKGDGAWHRCRR
ncbi:MAG TPA: hypothetical protein VIF38_02640 [Burkholderiales bacterium]